VIDESKAATVCMIFPGFIASCAAAQQKFGRAPREKNSTQSDALVKRI